MRETSSWSPWLTATGTLNGARHSKRTLFAFRVLLLALVIVLARGHVSLSQSALPPPKEPDGAAKNDYIPALTFDVASIRESPQADSYMVRYSFVHASSTFSASNITIGNLISAAYRIRSDQTVNLPAGRTMYMIEAKGDSSADERLRSLNDEQRRLEQQHMLQGPLGERFHLKAHWEMRTSPTYDLVVGKSGAKMDAAKDEPMSAEGAQQSGGHKFPPIYQQGSSGSSFYFIAHRCSTKELSEALASQFGRPVNDRTGLTNKYDFKLHYHDTRLEDRAADDSNPVPPLDMAIQDQLGLKLVPSTGEEKFFGY